MFYLLPACGWVAFCLYRWWQAKRGGKGTFRKPLTVWEKALRGLAFLLAIWALTETGIRLIAPQLVVSDWTSGIARRWLVPTRMGADFEITTTNGLWRGKLLKTLLDNVELANYNRHELSNWPVDEDTYQKYVLSPVITGKASEQYDWRRPLWEEFYPRIRKEPSPISAAMIVVCHLRVAVTIVPKLGFTPEIMEAWNRQITDEPGFEVIYVAALRSVGIGAKLNASGQTELWTGKEWVIAPWPSISSFLP